MRNISFHHTVLFALFALLLSLPAHSDGVTIIAHGWNPNSESPVWLSEMQTAIAERYLGGEQNFGKITITSDFLGRLTAVCNPWNIDLASSSTGEIIVTLDWSSVANHLLPNGKSTQEIAAAVESVILNGQNGKKALAELPIHLIGHSRGGSLVCELARRLGEQGLVVDHLSPLDPHPLTASDPQSSLRTIIDAPALVYENVVFADAFSQFISYPQGQQIPGAYNRYFASLPGGYHNESGGAFADHRNVYLWYHGTIDLSESTGNGEAEIGAQERQSWWNEYETENGIRGARSGFYYSRINGKGNRLSADRPVSEGDRIVDGYNQSVGGEGARESLAWSSAVWPNIVRLEMPRGDSGVHQIAVGTPLEIRYALQDYDSESTVSFYADLDRNPYNDNAIPLGSQTHSATGKNILRTSFTCETSTLTQDTIHYIAAKITDTVRTRYFYTAAAIYSTSGPSGVAEWTLY
ncbi:MAG TPA: hypothetical protein PK395_21115 [bacterium]|nr:hypothetical protein [bacterium]HQP99580.1 hypothetical protein [bacterium]